MLDAVENSLTTSVKLSVFLACVVAAATREDYEATGVSNDSEGVGFVIPCDESQDNIDKLLNCSKKKFQSDLQRRR